MIKRIVEVRKFNWSDTFHFKREVRGILVKQVSGTCLGAIECDR